jgi:hypothetical protein
MVALPPPARTGAIDYDRIFLSLASDFGGANVRLAIGRPPNFRFVQNVNVPAGRKVVQELQAGDEVASIIHNSGEPVAVLIEYQGV